MLDRARAEDELSRPAPTPLEPRPRKARRELVPFDMDYAQLGWIEPEIVERIVGWANEDELEAAGMDRIIELGSGVPVAWTWNSRAPKPPVEPIPIIEHQIRWWKVPD